MVREMTVKGDPVYQCETCSTTFETEAEAEEHERNCAGPATM